MPDEADGLVPLAGVAALLLVARERDAVTGIAEQSQRARLDQPPVNFLVRLLGGHVLRDDEPAPGTEDPLEFPDAACPEFSGDVLDDAQAEDPVEMTVGKQEGVGEAGDEFHRDIPPEWIPAA